MKIPSWPSSTKSISSLIEKHRAWYLGAGNTQQLRNSFPPFSLSMVLKEKGNTNKQQIPKRTQQTLGRKLRGGRCETHMGVFPALPRGSLDRDPRVSAWGPHTSVSFHPEYMAPSSVKPVGEDQGAAEP